MPAVSVPAPQRHRGNAPCLGRPQRDFTAFGQRPRNAGKPDRLTCSGVCFREDVVDVACGRLERGRAAG